MSPEGNCELVPVHLVALDPADLVIVGQTLEAFGRATLACGDELLADHAAPEHLGVGELTAGWGRAYAALLDLRPDPDTAVLATLIGRSTELIVLTVDQYAAPRRLTDRYLAIFHLGDPFAASYTTAIRAGTNLDPRDPLQGYSWCGLNGTGAGIPCKVGVSGRPGLWAIKGFP